MTRVAFDGAQFFREPPTDVGRDLGVLEEQGALEKLPAVQTGAQDKMTVEQRAGLAEERQEIVAHEARLFPGIDCFAAFFRGGRDDFDFDLRPFRQALTCTVERAGG